MLCDTFDTSISIVSIDVSIPVSKRTRYIAIYRGVTIPPSIATLCLAGLQLRRTGSGRKITSS